MRVFTAMPVIVRGQVAGVVYASRTPSNVFKYLYDQRGKVALAMLFMIVPTLADRLPVSPHHHRADARADRAHQPDRQGRPQRAAPAEAPRHQRIRAAVAELSRHGAPAEYALEFHLDLRHPCVARVEIAADIDTGRRRAVARRRRCASTWTTTTGASSSTTSSPTPTGWRRYPAACAISPARKTRSRSAPPSSSDAIVGLRSAFAALDIRANGELDVPMRISRGKCHDHLLQSRRQRDAPWQHACSTSRPRGRTIC